MLAGLALVRLSYPDIIRWAAATTEGCCGGGMATMARMLRWLGATLSPGGDPAAVLAEAEGAADTAEVNLVMARGILRLWGDDLAGAHTDLSSVLERATRGEVLLWPSMALGALRAAAYRAGRLDEAVLYSELAVATATEAGRGWGLTLLHTWACYPRAARGDWAEAQAHATAAEAWAGDDEAFLAAATSIDTGGGSARANTHGFGAVLADALVRLGRQAEADAALQRYEQTAAPVGERPFAAMTAARARARLAAAGGDWEIAALLFDRAVELAGTLGMPIEAARSHLAAGRAALEAGRTQPAAYHLHAAMDCFDSLGAEGYAGTGNCRGC